MCNVYGRASVCVCKTSVCWLQVPWLLVTFCISLIPCDPIAPRKPHRRASCFQLSAHSRQDFPPPTSTTNRKKSIDVDFFVCRRRKRTKIRRGKHRAAICTKLHGKERRMPNLHGRGELASGVVHEVSHKQNRYLDATRPTSCASCTLGWRVDASVYVAACLIYNDDCIYMERTGTSDRDGDEWGKVEEVDVDTVKEEHSGAKGVIVDTSRARERESRRARSKHRDEGVTRRHGVVVVMVIVMVVVVVVAAAATRVEQPVVCRPTDKQRRYCKCIGSTCCGASLAAFLRDTTYERLWLFTRSIVRSGGSILSYRVRLPRRRETIVATYALYRARFLSLFLDFLVSKDPVVVRLCFCLSFTFRRLSRSLFPRLSVRLARPMDSRERIENNKADHVTQVQMRRNYTSDTVSFRVQNICSSIIYTDSQSRVYPSVFPLHPRGKCSAPSVNRVPPERIKNTSLIVNDGPADPFDRDYCTDAHFRSREKVESRIPPFPPVERRRIFHRSVNLDTPFRVDE